METTEVIERDIDFTKPKEVLDFLQDKRKDTSNYYKEYEGDRKLRELQIGKREDYTQGKRRIQAERITVNLQKKIVKTAAAFLLAEEPTITVNDSEDKGGAEILKSLKKNRINSKLLDFAKSVMSTTMGVFIFSKTGGEVKARFFDHETGIYTPRYDVYGDLVAFYWEFVMDDKKHIWVFDDHFIYKYIEGVYQEFEDHKFDVIPVVFLDQKEPEWFDVKEMIDRLEMIMSKLAGSNNYFAFPILKLKGGTQTVENKDGKEEEKSIVEIQEDGKAILLGHAIHNDQLIQADAEFLQRDTGVASIELEMEYLKEMIFLVSQTPNLSFDNVKGIGAISGRALELMLQDAINKAKEKQGDYRIVVERIISVIASGLGIETKDLEFDIRFNLSLPKDLSEEIRTLVEATGGRPVLSQESGIKLSPFTENVQTELDNLTKEESLRNGSTFNIEE